jgi:hypothetical protein
MERQNHSFKFAQLSYLSSQKDLTTIKHRTANRIFTASICQTYERHFSKRNQQKFDKLIIDEGQDLIREEYLNLFDSMVTGGLANGNWEIYGDFERQAIFAQLSKEEMLGLASKNSGTFKLSFENKLPEYKTDWGRNFLDFRI